MKTERGQIVLTPVRIQCADAVWTKLDKLDIAAADIGDAVEWARTSSGKTRR